MHPFCQASIKINKSWTQYLRRLRTSESNGDNRIRINDIKCKDPVMLMDREKNNINEKIYTGKIFM